MINLFTSNLMTHLTFPQEAIETLSALEQTLSEKQKMGQISALAEHFMTNHPDIKEILPTLDEISEECGLSNYTTHLYFLLSCTPTLFENYQKKHISTEIFWDSMNDFKCKLVECHEVKGVWGIFTATWYPRFFEMTRFALGRFQYEPIEFTQDTYRRAGFTVNNGDTVYNSHIPSCGPMPKEVRFDSYRRAYAFFKDDLQGKPIAIVCHSWLLFPEHKNFLPKGSNILGFMDDFDIIKSETRDKFDDCWRIFGKDHTLLPERLPRDSSLRRAYADYLTTGGKAGNGFGILLFDGEKIL